MRNAFSVPFGRGVAASHVAATLQASGERQASACFAGAAADSSVNMAIREAHS
jgi:hypothetical protein